MHINENEEEMARNISDLEENKNEESKREVKNEENSSEEFKLQRRKYMSKQIDKGNNKKLTEELM